MKYYHFIAAESAEKCYKAEVVFLRNMMEEDYETYERLETSLFEAFQALEGSELESYFSEADEFFATVEAYQEQAHEEGVAKVVGRTRKSAMFKMAHAIAKAIRKEGDSYSVTFGACLRLVSQFI